MPVQNEKRQTRLLIGVILCILAVAGFNYRDAFIPKPGTPPASILPEERIPSELPIEIFSRKDFQLLEGVDAVPVRPMQRGSKDAFSIPESER